MTRQARVHRVAAASPDDVAGLAEAFGAGRIDPRGVVAIFGKTEGNGNVNDWTRALAVRALHDVLSDHAGQDHAANVCLVMSGGTEGGLSPHWIVFEVGASDEAAVAGALAVGHARTAPLAGHSVGRTGQIDAVADGVRQAMADAGIADPADVHLVQVKCPLLTSERVAAVRAAGHEAVTPDTLKSMGFSRAASALGVAVALGEIDRAPITDERIGRDWSLFSGRASCSAGVELLGHEIVVLGTGAGWSGPLRIDHAIMRDGIDIEPVRVALARLGLAAPGQLDGPSRDRVVALVAKTESGSSGLIRGNRHTMLTDSDIASTRHARAFTGGVLAGLIGHTELFVSGGAEHQGPDGGGPVAIIARAGSAGADLSHVAPASATKETPAP